MPERGYDAVVIGAGHNGLVAAALLAGAGRSVLVLEQRDRVGGAAVSEPLFDGVDARISAYSYLVSLFPAALLRRLGIRVELRRRPISSYTPAGDTGLFVGDDAARTCASFARVTGAGEELARWKSFYAELARAALRLAPTLLEPLRSGDDLRALLGDEGLWQGLFKAPLSVYLEDRLRHDVPRGVALTDGLIGTFASATGAERLANRCFLYHVIGDGTGLWKVPVGGMGALSGALADAAARAGAVIRTASSVTGLDTDGRSAELRCSDGRRVRARHVLAAVAPAVLEGLAGELGGSNSPAPEGAQLKLNLLLRRLPRVRDPDVTPEQAFTGTFHVHEGYEQLQRAYEQAGAGQLPDPVPCEAYCHSLTDPTILGPELRAAGAQTLTVFALQLPARLFATDPAAAKREAVAATLRSFDSVLAEPLADCLWRDADGAPCLHATTPLELEAQLAMPGGHIFHRDLSWPYAESASEIGRWGVETRWGNVLLCGAGARRGGGVSGIPGHNAARALGVA